LRMGAGGGGGGGGGGAQRGGPNLVFFQNSIAHPMVRRNRNKEFMIILIGQDTQPLRPTQLD
jgi:hypothetical protein